MLCWNNYSQIIVKADKSSFFWDYIHSIHMIIHDNVLSGDFIRPYYLLWTVFLDQTRQISRNTYIGQYAFNLVPVGGVECVSNMQCQHGTTFIRIQRVYQIYHRVYCIPRRVDISKLTLLTMGNCLLWRIRNCPDCSFDGKQYQLLFPLRKEYSFVLNASKVLKKWSGLALLSASKLYWGCHLNLESILLQFFLGNWWFHARLLLGYRLLPATLVIRRQNGKISFKKQQQVTWGDLDYNLFYHFHTIVWSSSSCFFFEYLLLSSPAATYAFPVDHHYQVFPWASDKASSLENMRCGSESCDFGVLSAVMLLTQHSIRWSGWLFPWTYHSGLDRRGKTFTVHPINLLDILRDYFFELDSSLLSDLAGT